MDIPDREIFLAGFGWAGVASLLTWLIPVAGGAPLSQNVIELAFGVLIVGGVAHAIYNDRRANPSGFSLALAVGAALFSTMELVRVAF